MTCREAISLVPLLLDGELEARQMRALVMHSTRCTSCETELRELERLQQVVSETVLARVDELDLSTFWPRIEQRLGTRELSPWQRLRVWWDDGGRRWAVRVPAFAVAAAVAALALAFLLRGQPATITPAAPQVAAVDNAATIDSLDTDSESIAVLSDPETRTTLLWVNDDVVLGDAP
jgi:anti-sigma factor RsiW